MDHSRRSRKRVQPAGTERQALSTESGLKPVARARCTPRLSLLANIMQVLLANPNGIQSFSPGLVAAATYPGSSCGDMTSTLKGLHPYRGCNPFRVDPLKCAR